MDAAIEVMDVAIEFGFKMCVLLSVWIVPVGAAATLFWIARGGPK